MDFEDPIDVGAETAAVATGATLPAIHLETPPASSAAEAVRFDLGMAKTHGAMTLAYLARAGWRLACEKEGVGHGAWMKWCEEELCVSYFTADRYIKFYYSTVGEHLRTQGTARRLVEDLTDAMIADATAGLESKTATGAMIELGIVKPPPNWGGKREGAGRKAKDATLPSLSQAQAAERIWTAVMNMIEKPTVRDAIPLLSERAAEVCLDRLEELARAMRLRVKEGK